MTDRAAFEALARANNRDVERLDDGYRWGPTEFGWQCWQASRAQALEEAAALIESTHETTTTVDGGEAVRHLTKRKIVGDLTGSTWAAAIRALGDER